MTWLDLDVVGEDRREPGAAGRQAARHLLVVELDADDERRRLDRRSARRRARRLRLAGGDGLQHRLHLAGVDLAREDLERDLHRLADRDVAGVDLRDFGTENRLRRVDEGHHRRLAR